jgi:hypothetical protein
MTAESGTLGKARRCAWPACSPMRHGYAAAPSRNPVAAVVAHASRPVQPAPSPANPGIPASHGTASWMLPHARGWLRRLRPNRASTSPSVAFASSPAHGRDAAYGKMLSMCRSRGQHLRLTCEGRSPVRRLETNSEMVARMPSGHPAAVIGFVARSAMHGVTGRVGTEVSDE